MVTEAVAGRLVRENGVGFVVVDVVVVVVVGRVRGRWGVAVCSRN